MRTPGTLLLSRHEIAELLTIEECMGAVEAAFRVYAEGRAPEPSVSHVDASDGIFHIKAGGLGASGRYVAVKVNGNLRMDVTPVNDLAGAVGQSDICITCTTSRQFFLRREFVAPGTFVGTVGADSPEKQELDPALLASSKVVVDLLGQCATMGDLHHALRQGVMTTADVHAELGEVILGRKPGRTSPHDVVVFDSTGTALQDVAAASIVYEKAIRNKKGMTLQFFE